MHRETKGRTVTDLHAEIEGLRKRVEHAVESGKRPELPVDAAAAAGQIKRLCQEASSSSDKKEIEILLCLCEKHINELEKALVSTPD